MTLINSFIDSYRNIYALPSVLLFSYACFSLGSYHTNRNLNFDASRMPREGLQRKARSTAGSGTRTCSEKPDRSAAKGTPKTKIRHTLLHDVFLNLKSKNRE